MILVTVSLVSIQRNRYRMLEGKCAKIMNRKIAYCMRWLKTRKYLEILDRITAPKTRRAPTNTSAPLLGILGFTTEKGDYDIAFPTFTLNTWITKIQRNLPSERLPGKLQGPSIECGKAGNSMIEPTNNL